MITTDNLTEAIEQLTSSDYRGLLQISAHKFDPLNTWFLSLAWAGIHSEEAPRFAPAAWQTFEVRDALQAAGGLAKLAGRRLHRINTLCSVLIDQLLEDLKERRAL